MKECRHCGQSKPLVAFWKTSRSRDGYRAWCRECLRQRRQELKALGGPAPPRRSDCAHCGGDFTATSNVQRHCSARCRKDYCYARRRARGLTRLGYLSINGNWHRYFGKLVTKQRRQDGLTREILLDLLQRQDYRCALTGVLLTCRMEHGVRCWTNASVDRLQPGAAYSADNVQLVCAAVNRMRSDWPLEEYIAWCVRVAEYADNKLSVGRFLSR